MGRLSVGFLHTGATFAADLNLVIQLAMGVTLLLGMRLARQRRFRAHGRCQTAVMLLNLVMIAVIMIPSFRQQVAPNLGKAASDAYYAWATVHAALGSIAELLGLYVVLVATGVRFVPVGLRFRNYRAWMRTTIVLWWIVIGFGVGTYVVWYVRGNTPVAAAAPAPAAPSSVTITMQNFTFDPTDITIPAGTTVIWNNTGGRHTVESADGSIKSDTLIGGQTYQKKFDTPGTYEYFCGNHGSKNGTGMSGRIVVTAR